MAFVINSELDAMNVVIQCKGFERLEYDEDQHRQCRAEIAKYRTKGPYAPEYWLIVNRPIKDRRFRDELKNDLEELVRAGKAGKAELLDREPMVEKLRALASARLLVWAEAKRAELFEYYESRLQFVRYISGVPFNNPRTSTLLPTDETF
jgi:hypothetical protein